MPWFKVDDAFHSHLKVMPTKAAALGLWVVAGSWSSANLTEGFIPDAVLPRLMPGAKRLAKDLVTSGLWERTDKGFTFHDWADYNPTAEEVREDREAARERMRKLRARRREQPDSSGETSESRELVPAPDLSDVRANMLRTFAERSDDVRNPVPSRPVPVPSATTSSQSSTGSGVVGDRTDDHDFSALDEMITRLLATLTPDPVTTQHAAWVRQTILGKARGPIRDRSAYLRRALQQDARPYLPQPTIAAVGAGRRCTIHHQAQPCIGCAADSKAKG
ncbi:hypothetical protein [Streptosporangium sp. NPDC001681]|uniref:hypothetical protein n=1 Tax=Streptosporangium sp. NPDC001681 TaxID=3154395 RepID=UPI003328DFCE